MQSSGWCFQTTTILERVLSHQLPSLLKNFLVLASPCIRHALLHRSYLPSSCFPLSLPVAMALNKRYIGAAANGFGPRTLLKHEAEALFRAWYPCSPDMRAGGRWSIGLSGVHVADAPRPRDRDSITHVRRHYWHELTAEHRQQDKWNPSYTDRYEAEFRRIRANRVTRWDGPGPLPRDSKNKEGRYAF